MTDGAPLSPEQTVLVRGGQAIVRRVARQVARRFALDEAVLLGVAHEALNAAARTFDAAHERTFDAHAATRVYGETFDFARQERTSLAVVASMRLRRFGLAAADAMVDDGDVLRDDDATTRRRLDDQCARIEAAVLTGFGGATGWPGADERVAAKEMWQRTSALLIGARAALPEEQRRLLELHYDAGEPLVAAAKKLGISYRTAKRHHRAALDALRVAFQHEDES